jgi:hypothetical protein
MKLRHSLLVVLVVAVLIGCGGGGGGDGDGGGSGSGQFGGNCGLKITNGSTCSAGDGPIALVLLESRDGTPRGLCTGAFITPSHVLTAAHCFGAGFPRIEVQVGSGIFPIRRSFIPPSYQPNGPIIQADDFAVIELGAPVSGVATLPLLASETIEPGRRINIIGFGLDQNGQSVLQPFPFTDGLRKGTMIVEERDASNGIFSAAFNSTRQSVCEGDSGGPAIVIAANGRAAIAGVAQAVGESTSDVIRCLDNSSAFFTPVATGSLVSFVRGVAGGVEVF